MAGETLYLQITLDENGAVAKVNNLGQAIGKAGGDADHAKDKFHGLNSAFGAFEGKIKAAFDRLFSFHGLIATVAGTTGLGLLARSFVDAASTSESYRIRLDALLGSTIKGAIVFKDMADYAAKVPFTYEQIMAAATNLSGVLKGGVAQIKAWMPLIGDLAAASGLSIEQTTQQVIRMYSAGAGSADLFRERGVLAMMGFAAGVTYTTQESIDKMLGAWNAADSKFKGAADKLGKTWAGMMSMIQDRWFQFRNLVMDAGLFDTVKQALDGVIKKIDLFSQNGKLGEWAKAVAGVVIDSFRLMTEAAAKFLNIVTWALEGWIKTYGVVMKVQTTSVIASVDLAITELDIKMRNIQKKIAGGETAFGQTDRLMKDLQALNEERKRLVLGKEPYVEQLLAIANLGDYAEGVRKLGMDAAAGFSALSQELANIDTSVKKSTDSFEQMGEAVNGALAPVLPAGSSGLSGFDTRLKPGLSDFIPRLVAPLEPSNIEPKIDHVAEYFQTQWDSAVSSMGGAFTDNLINGGNSFIKTFRQQMLSLFVDQSITQTIFKPLMSQLWGPEGILNKAVPGMAGATSGQLAGAGYMGYEAGGIGGAIGGMGGWAAGGAALGGMKIFSEGGAMAGMAGPVGMAVGIGLGSLVDDIFKSTKKPEVPEINLLFERVGDEIRLAGESWEHTGKSNELIEAIQDTLDTQIQFYKKIGFILGENLELPSSLAFSFNSLEDPTASLMRTFFGQNALKINEVFDTLMDELFESSGFGARGGAREYFDSLFGSKTTPGMTAKTWGEVILSNAPDTEIERIFEKYQEKIGSFQDMFSGSLSGAFISVIQGGALDDFSGNVKESIYNAIVSGTMQAFTAREMWALFPQLGGIPDILKQYAGGEITGEEAVMQINQGMVGLDDAINGLTPIMKAISGGFETLADALGINTNALTNNTDALIGPVESFLRDLNTGSLAPVLSAEGMERTYNELLASAMANPASFSEFAGFARSDYLPFQAANGGYSDVVAGVSSDVQAMPWYSQSKSATPTAQEIGAAVAQAITTTQPGGNLSISVNLDGKQIAATVVDEIESSPNLLRQISVWWKKIW